VLLSRASPAELVCVENDSSSLEDASTNVSVCTIPSARAWVAGGRQVAIAPAHFRLGP
jgi:hypothetical protein